MQVSGSRGEKTTRYGPKAGVCLCKDPVWLEQREQDGEVVERSQRSIWVQITRRRGRREAICRDFGFYSEQNGPTAGF